MAVRSYAPQGCDPVRSIEGSMERRPSMVAEALGEWLDDLTFDRSPQTIATYRSLLKLPDLTLDGLDRAFCRQWMTEQVRRRKPAGAQTACAALRSFCSWLVGRGWLAVNPTDGTRAVRVPEPPARALSARQVEALWQAAGELDSEAAREGGSESSSRRRSTYNSGNEAGMHEASQESPVGPMPASSHGAPTVVNRLLLSLLSAGLRRAEVAGLRWQDMDFERGTMTVFGKGRKYRRVLIPRAARELLNENATDRNAVVASRPASTLARRYGQESVVRTPHSTTGSVLSMNDDQVYAAFKKIARRAEIPWAHPHLMRHTFATNWLRRGGSSFHLMNQGGWADDAMVRRYAAAALTDAALDEARRLEE